MENILKFLGISLFIHLFSTVGFADYYQPNSGRGASVVRHDYGEECVLPRHFEGAEYKTKDVEKEAELCSLDFYTKASSTTRRAVGVCPKVTSTNPGVELYLFAADSSKDSFEQKECLKKDDDRDGKKLGKFKQSLTCSYTPSILAYYHLSRMLGNIGNVPASVIRTMDKEHHLSIVKSAGDILSRLYPNEDPIIEQAWKRTWPALHADPEGRTMGIRSSMVFSQDYKFVYGALSQNPKKEFKYTELFTRNYATRYQEFKLKPQYKTLLSPTPLAQVYSQGAPQARLETAAQTVTQMQDLSDMIILDHLLSQADRIGNMHFTYEYYILNGNKVETIDAEIIKNAQGQEIVDPAQAASLRARHAVLVKKLMIRDNDCGVMKSNEARKNQLLKDVSHVNPITYRKLLWLEGLVKNSEEKIKTFFESELLFSQNDWVGFKTYLLEVTSYLRGQCMNGKLHLDLNLDDVVAGRAPLDSRSFCQSL